MQKSSCKDNTFHHTQVILSVRYSVDRPRIISSYSPRYHKPQCCIVYRVYWAFASHLCTLVLVYEHSSRESASETNWIKKKVIQGQWKTHLNAAGHLLTITLALIHLITSTISPSGSGSLSLCLFVSLSLSLSAFKLNKLKWTVARGQDSVMAGGLPDEKNQVQSHLQSSHDQVSLSKKSRLDERISCLNDGIVKYNMVNLKQHKVNSPQWLIPPTDYHAALNPPMGDQL